MTAEKSVGYVKRREGPHMIGLGVRVFGRFGFWTFQKLAKLNRHSVRFGSVSYWFGSVRFSVSSVIYLQN